MYRIIKSSNELAVPQPGNSRSSITIVSLYRLRNAANEFSRVLSEVLGAEQNSENLPDIVDISFGLHGVRHAEGAIDLPDLLSTLSRMSHSLSAIRDVAIAPENVDPTSGSSIEILSNPSDSNSPDSNAPTADLLASAPENIDPPSPPDHDEAGPPDVVDESEGAMQNGAAQIIESPAEQNPLVPLNRDDGTDPARWRPPWSLLNNTCGRMRPSLLRDVLIRNTPRNNPLATGAFNSRAITNSNTPISDLQEFLNSEVDVFLSTQSEEYLGFQGEASDFPISTPILPCYGPSLDSGYVSDAGLLCPTHAHAAFSFPDYFTTTTFSPIGGQP
ncbi:hypothetical protein QAD02_008380 [Eretmocerus hayati]|uniref:Uncharacterized protein n=1 Tax=Eretmocerus hayati TaxID=131215 RepID=A0ACC2N6X2_9HYME|nr:hypothetical protein QAD02_008380 [Eretmocerus hayati]